MLNRVAVLDLVGLNRRALADMPQLSAWATGKQIATIQPMLPALTCPVQATYLTGCLPAAHGIVGNGWYFADEAEIRFWRQCDRLVQRPRLWEAARAIDPAFTCANLFWWYNMYSAADWSVTPRPIYTADGGKVPDIYTQPAALRDELQQQFGRFPLFDFWGPRAGLPSSAWIAAAARSIEQRFAPTLALVYLPHLDYDLQRFGPGTPRATTAANEIDALVAGLIAFYEARGVDILVLSEYGITTVQRPVHINRYLREQGWLTVREELGRELMDPGASRAFAVADHQLAHVHVREQREVEMVRAGLLALPGMAAVHRRSAAPGLDHSRSGDLVAVAEPDAWFTYYHWLDDAHAPDFARTVDIHRKPGYDPVELFLDGEPWVRARILLKLARKKLGLRTLMDVIPLDALRVRGSHGQTVLGEDEKPVLIGAGNRAAELAPTEVRQCMLSAVFGSEASAAKEAASREIGRDRFG